MKWVAEKLIAGETVTFKPRGKSMEPLIRDGQEVTVVPWDGSPLPTGSVVLCQVMGRIYLHKIIAVRFDMRGTDLTATSYLIGNNKGRTNGWTRTIFGVLEK